MGFLGGPLNGGWLRPPATLALSIYPPSTRVSATVSLDVAGGAPSDAVTVILLGVNQAPSGPYWIGLFGLVCAGSDWTQDMRLPALPPSLITSIEFQGVTLSNGVLRFTSPASLRVR
jgi:hypothetical protein